MVKPLYVTDLPSSVPVISGVSSSLFSRMERNQRTFHGWTSRVVRLHETGKLGKNGNDRIDQFLYTSLMDGVKIIMAEAILCASNPTKVGETSVRCNTVALRDIFQTLM